MTNEEKLNEIKHNNIKREFAVVSCLLNKPELLLEYPIDEDMFNNSLSRDIFKIIYEFKKKYDKDEIRKLEIDFIKAEDMCKNMSLKVKKQDLLDTKNALSSDGYISIENFPSYIDDLRDVKSRIKMANIARSIVEMTGDPKKSANNIIFEATNRVSGLEDSITIGSEPYHLSTASNIFEDCKSGKTLKVAGIETGFQMVDDAIDGLLPGSLTVLGARAKVGKSAFGLNAAINIAKKYGEECPVLYIDTEMGGQQQMTRALSILSKIPAKKIRRHDLNQIEIEELNDANNLLKKLPIYHLYTPNFTIDGIVSLVRKMYNKKGIGVLIYDYIKLPDNSESLNKNMQEYQVLGVLTNALKNKIAGKLHIPVLTFGQLNREGVKQQASGDIDETSVGGSDRIIQYCSTYMVLRKPPEEELKHQPKPEDPEWKKMGKFGNRVMHILATRDGGDNTDPIPIYYQDEIITMREGKTVRDDALRQISESITISEQKSS